MTHRERKFPTLECFWVWRLPNQVWFFNLIWSERGPLLCELWTVEWVSLSTRSLCEVKTPTLTRWGEWQRPCEAGEANVCSLASEGIFHINFSMLNEYSFLDVPPMWDGERSEGSRRFWAFDQDPAFLMQKQQCLPEPPVPQGWCGCTKGNRGNVFSLKAWMGSSTCKVY